MPSIGEIDLLESQYWDKTEILLRHQAPLLENLIRQAYYHVLFWKMEMRHRGLKPEHIQTYEDLEKLPVIDEFIMRKQEKDFIADNANQFIFSRGNTGGSTGRPFNYLISRQQAEAIHSTQRRGWGWAGWRENHRLLTIAGGGLGPQDGKKIGVFGFTEEIAIRVYEEILSYVPQFFRGLPYLMDLFCSYLERLGLNVNIRSKATFLTSEVLLNSQRERIGKHLRSGSRSKNVSKARRLFCQLAVVKLGYPGAKVARFLGVNTSAVVRAASSEELPKIGSHL